jgi:hypothetical protein
MPHKKKCPKKKKTGGKGKWMTLVMREYRKNRKAGLAGAMKAAKKKRGR